MYLHALFAFNGFYQAHTRGLSKMQLQDVNDHWFSGDSLRPKGTRQVWGHPSGIAGVSSSLAPSPTPHM